MPDTTGDARSEKDEVGDDVVVAHLGEGDLATRRRAGVTGKSVAPRGGLR